MAHAEVKKITPKVEPVVNVILTLSKEEAQGLKDLLHGGVSVTTLSTLKLEDISAALSKVGVHGRTAYQLRWAQIGLIDGSPPYNS